MTPQDVISGIASLMNDTHQYMYTNENVLPYLNIAMRDLMEIFEVANVQYTNATSEILNIPAYVSGPTIIEIGPSGGPPQLPQGLVEIQDLWERQSGVDPWTKMARKEQLPYYEEGVLCTQFLVYTYNEGKIKMLATSQVNDLKIDFIKNMFNLPINPNQVNDQLPFNLCQSYLEYRGAQLCSMYIGENPTRAEQLGQDAQLAIDRALSIYAKGRQAINTRRRPFRAAFKGRSGSWGAI